MPSCSLILPPVSVSCTVSLRFAFSWARFRFSFLLLFFPLCSGFPLLLFSPFLCLFGTLLHLTLSHLFSPLSSRLGSALPNSHLLFCWNLWIFGHWVSLPLFRYSCQHSYFWSRGSGFLPIPLPLALYKTLYYLSFLLFLGSQLIAASVPISASSIYGAFYLL